MGGCLTSSCNSPQNGVCRKVTLKACADQGIWELERSADPALCLPIAMYIQPLRGSTALYQRSFGRLCRLRSSGLGIARSTLFRMGQAVSTTTVITFCELSASQAAWAWT